MKWILRSVLVLTAVAVVTACGGQPATRSAARFCAVYRQEKAAFLKNTSRSSGSSLSDMLAGVGAIGGLPTMFDRLDKVAPDNIEPDIARIRDSLNAQQKAAADNVSHPLAGLASGIFSGLMASDSWNRVGAYADQNCITPAEKVLQAKAANDAQAKAVAETKAKATH